MTPDAWASLGAVRDPGEWRIPERNADGEIVGTARRYDTPRKGKTKGFVPGGKRGLTFAHPLPKDAGLDASEPLLVCEGQTDTATAIGLGYVAIGRPGASIAMTTDLKRICADRHVCIVADNDWSDAGLRGASKLAIGLYGVAASVKILLLPQSVKDLREWCAEGTHPADRAEIDSAISNTDSLDDEAVGRIRELLDEPAAKSAHDSTRLHSRRMADVAPETLRWLWPGRIPLGKVTLLAGDPGLGKSFLTMDLAARVSTGAGWPDIPGERFEPGRVVILSAEDGLADTIRPRLDAAGADCTRIEALESIGEPDGGERALNLVQDLQAIGELIESRGDVKLLIIDPVSAYCGRTDSHSNAEVRGMLAPLAKLAERHGVAVLTVTHLNKSGGDKATYRAMGSLAFIAAARAGWLIVEDENDPDNRLMLPTKSNLAKRPTGMSFTLRDFGDAVPCVAWGAEPIDLSADDALAAQAGTGGPRGPEPETRNEAADWLAELLEGGPVGVDELKAEGDAAGFSWSTLRRAKDAIGARSVKAGMGGWQWAAKAEGAQTLSETRNLSTFALSGQKREGAQVSNGREKPEHLRAEEVAR